MLSRLAIRPLNALHYARPLYQNWHYISTTSVMLYKRAISNSWYISSLFIAQWESICKEKWRIYIGNECIGKIQADIKVAVTIICGLYVKILPVYESGSVNRYCRGRQEMICRFLQIIPFCNLNSLFDTAMQVTEAEEPLCSPLFGSDWRLGNCRLWSIWRIECTVHCNKVHPITCHEGAEVE
jgi:hypothetical protein